MPIEYTIRDGALRARASGVLDDEGLFEYVRRVIDDPTYDQVDADLFDARDVTGVKLTGEGVRKLATLIQSTKRSSSRVAVVASSPAMFGMARMFELLRPDVTVSVFQEMERAIAWLSAPPEPAPSEEK
jgi:hypothetical protein